MGNAVGRSKKAKVMKLDGETFKLETPARVNDVVKGYPGHVLLDSEAVKHFGLRAKPLEPRQELKPKKLYFLVQLPKGEPEEEKLTRRVRSSGIRSMNAKDRLEFLMLSKRSVSDLSLVQPPSNLGMDGPRPDNGPFTVKMRLPKAQLEKLMGESHDGTEVAEKIINLYKGIGGEVGGGTVEAKAELGGKREVHKPRPRGVSVTLIIINLFLFITNFFLIIVFLVKQLPTPTCPEICGVLMNFDPKRTNTYFREQKKKKQN